jgi:anhydro-N-acetylmuramic acid kinase
MRIIGLMSGTSADGIDAALCEITGAPPRLEAKILKGLTLPYDAATRQRILSACNSQTSHVDEICRLNFDLAEKFVEAIEQLGESADLIASHGQTIWHDINDTGRVTSTLQIASGAVLAEKTGITVINNFRERDVAAGGQGAPLTAYVDYLLLRHETKWRAIQNIGGMANVSFLPPLSDTTSPLLSFDTGLGNAWIDEVVYRGTQGRETYDKDGKYAAAGHVHGSALELLLDDPYYQRKPPKTTGREYFSNEHLNHILIGMNLKKLRDSAATFTALTAHSIANAYHDFAPAPIEEVIVGGGGSRNSFLMQSLAKLLEPIPVMTHEDIGINSDYKEALVFAVLAYESWHNRPATLPSQTGARHASVLGQITPSDNFASLVTSTWGQA